MVTTWQPSLLKKRFYLANIVKFFDVECVLVILKLMDMSKRFIVSRKLSFDILLKN